MLGVDLVHIPEFQKQLEAGGQTFLQKAFLPDELQKHTTEHLAGIWAAKESVMKAGGRKPENWTEIHIVYDDSGRPSAVVDEERYEVSISHHGEYAVAVAIKK